MRLDEINRRGFLKGVGATAASAAIPAAEVKGFIDAFTNGLGGVENVTILSKLLSSYGASRLNDFFRYAVGDTSVQETLTDDEANDLADKIVLRFGRDTIADFVGEDPDELGNGDIINFFVQEGNDSDDGIWGAIEELIGYEPEYLKVLNFIEEQGNDPDEFFDYHSGYGEVIQDLYMKELKDYSQRITANNLVQIAKDSSLPERAVRLAGMISTVIKRALGNDANVKPAEPAAQPQQSPQGQLPAPSDNDELGLSHISRMKDLAGIRK